MSRALRILHLADSHIGAELPARPRSSGPRRGDDFVNSYQRVLERAREYDVDLILHCGDLWDRSRPSEAAIAAAAMPLLKLAGDGIPIVLLPGNHERSALPDTLLLSHPNIFLVRRPATFVFQLRGVTLSVSALPCIRRGVAERFAPALQQTGWAATKADAHVLMLHQALDSSVCGAQRYRFRSGPDVLDRAAIPREFAYVACGHIHLPQTLEHPDGGGPLVYSGSCDRIDFAERDEPKGCVVVEIGQDGSAGQRFIEHEVRPMRLIPLDVSQLSRDEVSKRIAAEIAVLPPAAVASLRLTGAAAPGVLRGLRVGEMARDLRPDVLLSSRAGEVEFVTARAGRFIPATEPDVFDGLPTQADERYAAHLADDAALRALPNVHATYAFFDRVGRLLYVGKTDHLRTRVRDHLRGDNAAHHFAGWTRQIARVVARRAYSELEALLVEADLVRRLRPPFNRQMRAWARCVFLISAHDPGRTSRDGLSIVRDLPDAKETSEGQICFGPFSSRAAAERILEAAHTWCDAPPRVLREAIPESRVRVAVLHEVLGGVSNELFSAYETSVLERLGIVESPEDEAIQWPAEEDIPTALRADAALFVQLRGVAERCQRLALAETLRDTVLRLPGPEGSLTLIALREERLAITRVPDSGIAEPELLRFAPNSVERPTSRLRKDAAETFLTVARWILREALRAAHDDSAESVAGASADSPS